VWSLVGIWVLALLLYIAVSFFSGVGHADVEWAIIAAIAIVGKWKMMQFWSTCQSF
jgi:hypothetical protein